MATVAVAGATGALGEEILAVLDKAPWRPENVVALASATSVVPQVSYGDESLSVDDLATNDLAGVDVMILAVPPDVAREAGERAVGEGASVVDCSGTFLADADVPLVIPWVNPEALKELPVRGVIAIPGATALLIASVLGPLWRAGLVAPYDATVLVPASAEGREGIEELSRQVVALFNSGTPPRKVFEHGLAFDLLPQVGAPDPSGWTDRELRAANEVARIVGDGEGSVTLVGVPLFSGIAATLHLRTDAPIDRISQVLADGGVQLPKPGPRTLPRPRKVEGHPFAHVARIRQDPAGGVHLWVAMDNLRGAASVAVACAGLLLRSRQR